MPKVSVIIPTYNRGYIVRQAIESVLEQTLEDFELLIIDDGSTDNTRSVIESLNDHRVRYFYKTNGGPASARNFGLSKADSEYIAFLDSDDLWPKNYLKVMLENLEANRMYGVAYSSIGLVQNSGQIEIRNKAKDCKSGWITTDLFKKGFISVVAVVIRKEVLRSFKFDESLPNAEDSDFLLRLSLQTQFLYVPDILVHITKSYDSLSEKVGINCSRMLSLERLYFQLGGKELIPPCIAMVKLSHACRKVAEAHRWGGNQSAAITLYKRAIKYWAVDLRLYLGLVRTLLLSKKNDRAPNWKMPPPLPIGDI